MAMRLRRVLAIILFVAVAWYLYEQRGDSAIASALSPRTCFLAVALVALAVLGPQHVEQRPGHRFAHDESSSKP